ncbi:MAG: tetratricopeptide repeat protein [Planctomycetales bacterium]|nr:tetratricopeptide repeat protein [Planctomycetales bacterium]
MPRDSAPQFFSSEEYERRGGELAESGDLVGAIQVLREGLEVFPSTTELRIGLGHAYLQLEEFALAAREFREGLRLAPADSDLLRGLAVVLLRMGRGDEASPLLDRAAPGTHDDDQACVQVAEALLAAERPAEGLEYATRAVLANPESPEAELVRGLCLHAIGGAPDDKCRAFRRALELAPDRMDVVESWGHVLYEDGRGDEALAVLSRLPLDEIENVLTLERLDEMLHRAGAPRAQRAECRKRLRESQRGLTLDGFVEEAAAEAEAEREEREA